MPSPKITKTLIEALTKEGDKAKIAAKAILAKINTPEIATALQGAEREAYLKALDLTYGRRTDRITDMGFGHGNWYHGTTVDIPEFQKSALGLSTEAHSAKQGFFFTDDPSTASDYAGLAFHKGIIRDGDKVTKGLRRDEAVESALIRRYTAAQDKIVAVSKQRRKLVEERAAQIHALDAEKAKPLSDVLAVTDLERKIAGIDEQIKANNVAREEAVKESAAAVDHYKSGGQNVLPVHLKMDPLTKDFRGERYRDQSYANVMEQAKSQGKDAVEFRNTYDPANERNVVRQNIAAVFEPNQIRSKFAAFDPRFKDSPNILAAIAPASAAAMQNTQSPLDYLRQGFAQYQQKVVEPIAAKAKQVLTPTVTAGGKSYPTSSGVSDTIINEASNPLNYVEGPVAAGASALEFLSGMTPQKKSSGGFVESKPTKGASDMPYELIHEDEQVFRLKDKAGKEFSVAKQAINDAITQKIRGYAKGGLVTPLEEEQPSFVDSLPILRDTQAPQAQAQAPVGQIPEFQPDNFVEKIEYGLGKIAQPFINPFMEKGMGLEGQADYERALQQQIYGSRQTAPGMAPGPTSNLIAGPVTGNAMPQVPVNQADPNLGGQATAQSAAPAMAPTASGLDLTSLIGPAPTAGIGDLMKATKIREQSGTALAEETLAIQQQSEMNQQLAYNDYAANMARMEREQADLYDSIQKSQIDPNRFFNDRTTAGKVSSVIGLLLGGIGQGLAGGQNQALETLNKFIDRDIQAQRDNLGKKQTLFATNMQRLGDERAAWAATKAQIASLAQAKIEQAAARSSISTVKAAALEATGQIKMYQAKLNQEVAKAQTIRMLTNHIERTGDKTALSLLPAEQQKALGERLVPGYGAATDATQARKLQESIATTDVVNRSLGNLQAFGKKRYSDFSPEDKARANQIQQTLIGDLRLAIAGPGPLTESERAWMQDIISNPTDIFELNARAKLEEIQRNVNYRLAAQLKASGLTPKAAINFTPGVRK